MKRPLDWPRDAPRTRSNRRRRSGEWRNYVTLRDAIVSALHRLGASSIHLSTDIPNGRVGTPRQIPRDPGDPGMVVYFTLHRDPSVWYAYACDVFSDRVGNMGRVADMVARRLRPHFVGQSTCHAGRRATGGAPRGGRRRSYRAPPHRRVDPWWRDLGLPKPPRTLAEAESAFRAQVKRHHPDVGGDEDKMRLAVAAVERARSTMR